MEKAKQIERISSENKTQSSTPADKHQSETSGSSEGDQVFEASIMAEDIGKNIQQILTKLQNKTALEPW